MNEERVFALMKQLQDGIDLTVEEMGRLAESHSDLIELLDCVWAADDPERRKIRCGTLYLEEGDGGRASLVLRLRFPLGVSEWTSLCAGGGGKSRPGSE